MSEELKKYLDRDGRLTSELRDLIEGMSVSIDVSTGDHDSSNRLFGVVNEVMDDSHDKCGVTLLVYDAKPNFTPVADRELDVEAERREPPTLPRYLLDMIGEYGMARSDGVGQVEVQHRWETLIGGIKRYASDFARSAAQGTAPAPSKMLAAPLRYIFELEQKVVALEAKVAAQTESAPVSTEQDVDAHKCTTTGVDGQKTVEVSTEQAGDAWGVGSCGCQACNPHMIGRMMFICATCGDKRCPHAANHVLNCQGRAPSPNNSPVGADRRE